LPRALPDLGQGLAKDFARTLPRTFAKGFAKDVAKGPLKNSAKDSAKGFAREIAGGFAKGYSSMLAEAILCIRQLRLQLELQLGNIAIQATHYHLWGAGGGSATHKTLDVKAQQQATGKLLRVSQDEVVP
jgi:hypothetical protein